MALSRRKKVVFGLAAIALSVVGAMVLLLLADLVVHYRAERSAGLNRYGYRGPVVGRKQAGELRVAMLGGSTVFGYGVAWNESIAAQLEPKLREWLGGPVRVLNLGFNNEGAYAFVPNLEDFAYLDYDVVVLYEGYNDLPGDEAVNRSVYRRDSAVFRLIGYFPILPLYLDEKAKMVRYGNNLDAAYAAQRLEAEGRVVFRPNLAQRTSAGALEAIATMTKALDGQLASIPARPAIKASDSTLGCSFPYVTYCESIASAVRFARSRGDAVVVASQPRVPGKTRDRHTIQQATLADMMARTFGGDTRVAWADFSNLLDLENVDVTFDGMHLSPEANATVAAALVEPIGAVVKGAGSRQ